MGSKRATSLGISAASFSSPGSPGYCQGSGCQWDAGRYRRPATPDLGCQSELRFPVVLDPTLHQLPFHRGRRGSRRACRVCAPSVGDWRDKSFSSPPLKNEMDAEGCARALDVGTY